VAFPKEKTTSTRKKKPTEKLLFETGIAGMYHHAQLLLIIKYMLCASCPPSEKN
jgi:hypothetical protein